MRIGIVLAAIPGYSETFFRSKIRFLQETKGIEVVLFVDRKKKDVSWNLCSVVYGSVIEGNGFWGVINFIRQSVFVFLRNPIKSVKLFRLNRNCGFDFIQNLKSLVQSAHLLNNVKLDWLHFGFGTMAIGRENVAKVIHAKMAVSFRGFDIAIYPLKHPHCYRLVWERVDKVHVISDDLARLVKRSEFFSDKPILKITPAIDVDRFVRTERNQSLSTPLKIITVARLHWKKGLELTLEALSLLKRKGIAFQYTIIGEGDEYDRLIFAAHQLELEEHIRFMGKLPPEDVVIHLRESDIHLQYSIQEGFCNAVLEAQAMGLLCVVSDAEGLSENVIDGKTGWVVPRQDPGLLAGKLEEVIFSDEQRLYGIRKEAAARVSQQFNLEKQRKLFLEFYEYYDF